MALMPVRLGITRSICAVFALVALIMPVPGTPSQAAEGFFEVIEDLPVMPGLIEDISTRVVFDKPQGRIVQITARGKVARDKVQQFYREVLPQLGWTWAGGGEFQREGEVLELRIRRYGGRVTVRFSLSPQ